MVQGRENEELGEQNLKEVVDTMITNLQAKRDTYNNRLNSSA
jgi:hypothetical protein